MKIKSRMIKRIASVGLAAAMVFSFAACGGGSGDGSSDAEAADAFVKAQEAMSSVESMSYDIDMDMEMSASGQSMTITTTAEADYIDEPLQMKMDMNMDMGSMGSQNVSMYLVQSDAGYSVYTGVDDGSGNLTWSKEDVTDIADYESYDAKESFDLYLSSAESFKEIGSEKIGDVDTISYEGVIKGDALSEVIEKSGALTNVSSLGVTEEQVQSMIDELGDLNIKFWLSEDDYMPVKYEMDMTDMMQKIMDAASGDVEISMDKVFASMTLKNINGVSSIELPEEAQAAA